MFIDTHIHLDSKEYSADLDAVIKNADDAGVKYFINPGSDLRSLDIIPRICEKHPQILPAYGIHPHDAKDFYNVRTGRDLSLQIKSLLSQKAFAVGETGLDFHYNLSDPNIQKEVFIKHIYLAKEFNLPLIIHSRKAEEEIYTVLKKEKISKGVVHCYSGTLDYAKRFIDMGLYIGITGVITFPKAENIRELVKNIPLERLLNETDGPFLAPIPHRGKRNLPEYIPIIADKITQLAVLGSDPKTASWQAIQDQLFQNARDLFGF